MRVSETVGVAADATVGEATFTGVGRSLPDEWQQRTASTCREQERRGKLRQRVRDVQATAQRQWAAGDRVRALKRVPAAKPSDA